MNKVKQFSSWIFLYVLIPIVLTILSKWLVGICIEKASIISTNVSPEIKALYALVMSFSDIVEWLISIFIGILTIFTMHLIDIKGTLSNFMIDIQKNLVSTNAIITNPETKKIAITAKELDFYERKIYEEIESCTPEQKKEAFSIDILRWYSIQDLLFSPMYLDYFFNRGTQIGNPIRIIVIEQVSLATLSFLFLNLKANYKTYIITNKKFRSFCNELNPIPKKVLKGNPYLIKIDNTVKYGKYSDENDKPTDIKNKEDIWLKVESLISKSELLNKCQDTYTIKDIENRLYGR